MTHEDQHASGHDADLGGDFSAGEHGQNHGASEAGYAHDGRQGWETQAAAPDDGFGDPETTEVVEDDSQPPAKSRGGLLLPLLLFVLVLGAGGFAYWQFGMNSGQDMAQQHREEVRTVAAQEKAEVTPVVPSLPSSSAPTPTVVEPPPPAAVPVPQPAPVLPKPPVVSLPTPTPPVVVMPSETVVAQGTLAPEPGKKAPVPAVLPPPPLLDQNVELEKPGSMLAEQPESIGSAPKGLDVMPKPPSMPALIDTPSDIGGVAARQDKAALEKEVTELKKTVATLNDKIQQMQTAAASQDTALKQAQIALKEATTKAAAAVKVASAVPVKPTVVKKSAASEAKPSPATVAAKQTRKQADKKTAAVAPAKKAVVVPKEATPANKWVLRSVASGSAWLASSSTGNDLKEVHVGDTVPGLGTIKAITNKSGQWVVVGSLRNLK